MAAIRTVLVDKFSSCGNPFATLASTLTSVLVTPNNDNKLLVEVKQETPILNAINGQTIHMAHVSEEYEGLSDAENKF
jgi:hypothetical protein